MRKTPQAILKRKGHEKIVVLTSYDYSFSRILDDEAVDIILVGDSLGMTVLGHENTLPVTMEDMIHHTKAVSRGVKDALVVADMPFGSYQNAQQAVLNAKRFIREAGADAVKLEGGVFIEEQLKALVEEEIPIMGHVGMLPQSLEEVGGYKVQGKDEASSQKIREDALLLDQLGVFAMVLECMKSVLAKDITERVQCPTIGIGAGPHVDGQVLVIHDLLGFQSSVTPKYVRVYADFNTLIRQSISRFRQDVLEGRYPSAEETYS